MSLDRLIQTWNEVRAGFAKEVAQVPDNQFDFRATPEMRSVAEVVKHIVETQKIIVGEACRSDTNLMRQPFPEAARQYAPEVAAVNDKNGLLELLRSSMETSEASIRAAGDSLQQMMRRFDGKEISKVDFLRFAIAHEMYHRGQFTVYERLLSIEPALTKDFRKMFEKAAEQNN
jgi:uncharacterized damage-inducible protein DinB